MNFFLVFPGICPDKLWNEVEKREMGVYALL